jgi:hypothetical protein
MKLSKKHATDSMHGEIEVEAHCCEMPFGIVRSPITNLVDEEQIVKCEEKIMLEVIFHPKDDATFDDNEIVDIAYPKVGIGLTY